VQFLGEKKRFYTVWIHRGTVETDGKAKARLTVAIVAPDMHCPDVSLFPFCVRLKYYEIIL